MRYKIFHTTQFKWIFFLTSLWRKYFNTDILFFYPEKYPTSWKLSQKIHLLLQNTSLEAIELHTEHVIDFLKKETKIFSQQVICVFFYSHNGKDVNKAPWMVEEVPALDGARLK